ncbi:MAG: recombination regulator RecX [Gammaproteobacteria bacterium]|nr:recombination regulator RecX [Gammaproteobacteria bacterium]
MDLLARREHSCWELKTKLINKGWHEQTAEQVVTQLAAERLVSDHRFAENLVQARRQRGHGPVRIRKELSDKGVADDIIDKWLDPRDQDWLDHVRSVREKKFGKEEPGDFKERARQARFLQYRGYTFEQIQRALNNNDLMDD